MKRQWQVLAISSGRRPLPSDLIGQDNNGITHLSVDLTRPLDFELIERKLSSSSSSADCLAVVHCIGTLSDNLAYKRLKSGDLCSIASGLMALQQRSQADETSQMIEKLNEQTAYHLIDVCKRLKSLRTFGFVSTSAHLLPFPIQQLAVDKRYFQSKLRVESRLIENGDGGIGESVRRLIFRPGFIYNDSLLPLSATLSTMNMVKTQLLPSDVASFLPAPPAKPVHVESLASFIMSAIETSVSAIVEPGVNIFDSSDISAAVNR